MHENSHDSPPESGPLVPLTYTVAEVASLAGVSEATVYDWVKSRQLKRAVPMRHIKLNRAAVHRFLQGGGV
jgi:excisionase family DNA binding protein